MARPRPSLARARRVSVPCCVLLTCLSGCGGDFVSLGSTEPLLAGGVSGATGATGGGGNVAPGGAGGVWVVSEPVLEQEVSVSFANGTFTEYLEQLFFTRQSRVDDVDDAFLYRAIQAGSGFGGGQPLLIDGALQAASSPAISLDGTQLWFGALGEEGTDIWLSRGSNDTWGPAELVADLNSPSDDQPRPPAMKGTVMPLASRRGDGKHYQIYFAERAALGQPWQTPTLDLLGNVNAPDSESLDGFLTEDGLTLYFASTRLGTATTADLFRATRTSIDETFGEPELLSKPVNSDDDERDPWLDPHSERLYFTSNRSGEYAIYSAEMLK